MDTGTREVLLGRLADAIDAVPTTHPVRVAIDGPPATGKSTLGDELANFLRTRGRAVIRASTDGFHFPRARRYRRGRYSPVGCYHDSFNLDALREVLLDPLGPDGDRRYQHAVIDYPDDTPLSPPFTTAPADAVLVFDGVFLMRPELVDRWDLTIFVSTEFERAIRRARTRDQAQLGSAAEVERRYRARYLPSQRRYFTAARPAERADIVVYNDDIHRPSWDVRPH